MNESQFHKEIIARSNMIRYYSVENRLSSGMPDLFCLIKNSNRSFWLELKAGLGKIEPLQPAWHTSYYESGGISYLAWYDPILELVSVYAGNRVGEIAMGDKPRPLFQSPLKHFELDLLNNFYKGAV